MKPPLLLRLAALACSVLLAAGFVCYRAGALGWLTPNTASPADPGSNPPPAPTPPKPTMMSGTKALNPSAFIDGITPAGTVTLDLLQTPSPASKQPGKTFMIMGGPKSDLVFDSRSPPPILFQDLFREKTSPASGPPPAIPPTAKQPAPPITIMSGSKSSIFEPPPIAIEWLTPANPKPPAPSMPPDPRRK